MTDITLGPVTSEPLPIERQFKNNRGATVIFRYKTEHASRTHLQAEMRALPVAHSYRLAVHGVPSPRTVIVSATCQERPRKRGT